MTEACKMLTSLRTTYDKRSKFSRDTVPLNCNFLDVFSKSVTTLSLSLVKRLLIF